MKKVLNTGNIKLSENSVLSLDKKYSSLLKYFGEKDVKNYVINKDSLMIEFNENIDSIKNEFRIYLLQDEANKYGITFDIYYNVINIYLKKVEILEDNLIEDENLGEAPVITVTQKINKPDLKPGKYKIIFDENKFGWVLIMSNTNKRSPVKTPNQVVNIIESIKSITPIPYSNKKKDK